MFRGISEMKEECYQVQMGVYRNKNFAEQLMIELQQSEYSARIENDGSGYYIVKVGDYTEFNEVIQMEQKLKSEGYATIIVTS